MCHFLLAFLESFSCILMPELRAFMVEPMLLEGMLMRPSKGPEVPFIGDKLRGGTKG